MSYIHCHACNWEQDDFYDDGYNPAKSLEFWDKYIFGEKADELDRQFTTDIMFIKENGPLTNREVIAREYEKYARRIRNMKWVTREQFKAESNKVCPKCGKGRLDED